MPSPLLVPGRTVWRTEPCPRAAVLIDGAAFFGAVRAAFLAARHTIFVVGWDIDSRTELVGESAPADGLPATFGPFLAALVSRRPDLKVHLLLWDYSLVYAQEREKLPRLSLDWEMPAQVRFCLDSSVAFGSSHTDGDGSTANAKPECPRRSARSKNDEPVLATLARPRKLRVDPSPKPRRAAGLEGDPGPQFP